MRKRLNLDSNYIYLNDRLEERENLLSLYKHFDYKLGQIKSCIYFDNPKDIERCDSIFLEVTNLVALNYFFRHIDTTGEMHNEWKRFECASDGGNVVCEQLFNVMNNTVKQKLGDNLLFTMTTNEAIKTKFN
eukprot:TRINITY_DN5424_c0_g1_i1.p1 TRINITY_DN5424_c0_g1~~TRINITY_DN5424_c0_g1_i1.p1  ORF type:complete len:132 (+),score=32.38 TRINITY_DN5424_c0_g1_i1:75-470(+)